jgi:hypothetical protein
MSAFDAKRIFPTPDGLFLKSGGIHFADGLYITEKSVIESVHDFSLGYTT